MLDKLVDFQPQKLFLRYPYLMASQSLVLDLTNLFFQHVQID